MNHQKSKHIRQLRRRHHVRSGVKGTAERPRLTVFRSSKHIYAQLIDDLAGVTLATASSLTPDIHKDMPYGGNLKGAEVVGRKLAEIAKERGIDKAAFDRGHYKFHGRVKALAEAANAAGLLCCEPKEHRSSSWRLGPPPPRPRRPRARKATPKERRRKRRREAAQGKEGGVRLSHRVGL